jgi:hypothetical protein
MAAISNSELDGRIRTLLNKGWLEIPHNQGYGGTGGPGKFLEHQLGCDGGNDDIPDTGRWELKYHSNTSLLTLFHKEAQPRGHLETLVQRFGWLNNNNCKCFRHTITGITNRGFYIENNGSEILVKNLNYPDETFGYWPHDTLITTFAAKFRNLVIVIGTRKHQLINYQKAMFFEEPHITQLISAIEAGIIHIDFDARTKAEHAVTLRNHGTKFRISLENIRLLYKKYRVIG